MRAATSDRSIIAECLLEDLVKVFTATGGSPRVLRMETGPGLVCRALQRFCDGCRYLSHPAELSVG